MHWRRKWQSTPVFLPGESQGRAAWWAAVYGVAQSRTRLKRLSSSSSKLYKCPIDCETLRKWVFVPIFVVHFIRTTYIISKNLFIFKRQLNQHGFCSAFSPSINMTVKVMSNSLRPHGLYSPWDFPDQNTGVGSLSLLQGIFSTQGSNAGSFQIAGRFFSSLSTSVSISSVQFSCSVMSNSLQPHESQHARPPCPSPTPRVYSNSCPLSR